MYGTCFHSAIHLFYSIFLFLTCEIRGIFENKAIVTLSLTEVAKQLKNSYLEFQA